MTSRPERRRRWKESHAAQVMRGIDGSGRIRVNRDRREKRATCRMFGISGKRYRALERKHRREQREARA